MYVGVDPGASGGLARYGPSFLSDSVTSYHHRHLPMPDTERDVWEWFEEVASDARSQRWQVKAFIEKFGGYVGGDGFKALGSAMFNFGWSYGLLRMALTAAEIPFEEVTPQRWQRSMGVTPRDNKGGESKTAFKNRLKQLAQQLYPQDKVTHATADAILICEFCRRKHEGVLG